MILKATSSAVVLLNKTHWIKSADLNHKPLLSQSSLHTLNINNKTVRKCIWIPPSLCEKDWADMVENLIHIISLTAASENVLGIQRDYHGSAKGNVWARIYSTMRRQKPWMVVFKKSATEWCVQEQHIITRIGEKKGNVTRAGFWELLSSLLNNTGDQWTSCRSLPFLVDRLVSFQWAEPQVKYSSPSDDRVYFCKSQ